MGVQLQLLVIGHLCHLRIKHVHLNGFFLAIFLQSVKLIEHVFDFFHMREVLKDVLTSNFVINTIKIIVIGPRVVNFRVRVIVLIISNWPHASHLAGFEISHPLTR